MNRRKFLSTTVKAVGVMAIAPFLPFPEPKPKDKPAKKFTAVTEGCCPEHTKPEKREFDCINYTANITIQDYKPGEFLKYEDLSADPACDKCLAYIPCNAYGHLVDDRGRPISPPFKFRKRKDGTWL